MEKVEGDEYPLMVLRYIHQNPLKAEMVKRPTDWKWSSCRACYDGVCYPVGLLDGDYILNLFSEDRLWALGRFKEFNEAEC